MSTDDFESDGQTLGPNWTHMYSGEGTGKIPTDYRRVRWTQPRGQIQVTEHISMTLGNNGDIAAYGSLPNSSGEMVGARHKAGDPCAVCRKPFEAGHVVYADLEPNMSGTFRHRDCDDPTLAKGDGE